jgi:hypothetical protein
MAQYQVGDRVVAICDSSEGLIRIFGYGVYEGDFPHPSRQALCDDDTRALLRRSGQDAPDSLDVSKLTEKFNKAIMNNPRIKLDSGQTVWGCECWWGPVKEFEKESQGLRIETVDIDQERSRHAGNGSQADLV